MTRKRSKREGPTWILATQPGVGKLLAERLRDGGAGEITIESDGRSDLVVARSAVAPVLEDLPAEDLYLLLSEGPSGRSAEATAARLVEPDAWQLALNLAKTEDLPVGASTRYRVVVRVRSEARFQRTELRSALQREIGRWRPRWRLDDPAPVEFWVLETARGRFRAMVRLSTAEARARGGREVERHGALRPAIAAAMVGLAENPREGGRLLDCFCGSGTILAEAARGGWRPTGSDIDAAAVSAAGVNVPLAEIVRADAAALPFEDDAFDAVISNLPFGHQHEVVVPAGLDERAFWLQVVDEIVRVAKPGADVILLHPRQGPAPPAFGQHRDLRARGRTDVQALGREATIFAYRIARVGQP